MTCKACGQPYGCEHSDAEYQGVAPCHRRVVVLNPPRMRVIASPTPHKPRPRPEAPGSALVRPDYPRRGDGGAAVEPEREPA